MNTPPPTLSDSYKNAWRFYLFVVAGSLAWTSLPWIGILLTSDQFKFESVGIKDVAFKVVAPHLLAFALACVIVYAGFRVYVEWKEIPTTTRNHGSARWDYWVLHAFAALAVGFSVSRYLEHVMAPRVVTRSWAPAAVLGFIVPLLVAAAGRLWSETEVNTVARAVLIVIALFVGLVVNDSVSNPREATWIPFVTGGIIGYLVIVLLAIFRRRYTRRP